MNREEVSKTFMLQFTKTKTVAAHLSCKYFIFPQCCRLTVVAADYSVKYFQPTVVAANY